jgi:hypothetical protein
MERDTFRKLLHLRRGGQPKPPEIDGVVTRLLESAIASEADAIRSGEAGDRVLATQRYADAASRARATYEAITPTSIREQMLRADYGDMALQGLIGAGDIVSAAELADQLVGEAPDHEHFERVIKRVEFAGPQLAQPFWARRRVAGEAWEAFHSTLHSAPQG